MKSHIKRIHDVGSKAHNCDVCDKLFSTIGDLNQHTSNVHGKYW